MKNMTEKQLHEFYNAPPCIKDVMIKELGGEIGNLTKQNDKLRALLIKMVNPQPNTPCPVCMCLDMHKPECEWDAVMEFGLKNGVEQ